MRLLFPKAWLKAAVLSALVATALSVVPAHARASSGPVYTLQVDGLACPFCAYGIEKQIKRIDGVKSTSVDIKDGVVSVVMEEGATLNEATARKAVKASGFTLRGFKRKDGSE